MAESSQPWRVAESFLIDGLRDGRLGDVPVSESVRFQDPLSGGWIEGREDVSAYLATVRGWLAEVTVEQWVEEGGTVVVRGVMARKNGTAIPFAAWTICATGKVDEARMYWDPRELLRGL